MIQGHGEVTRTSVLAASAEALWAHATSASGINAELWPWLRMTVPQGAQGLDLAALPPDGRLGRSWLLLLGLLPVEYDDIRIVEVEPGRRFQEASSMALMRRWGHERIVEAAPGGTRVTDRLTFELRGPLARMPGASWIATALVAAVFSHRHRRLRRRFG